MDPGVIVPIFGILLVMIPVAGLTLALTLRLAVKPFVETLANALRDSRSDAGTEPLAGQILALAEEVETLTHEMRELRTAQEFDRKLIAERSQEAAGMEP
jgi:hypothetical protein